MRLLIPAKIAHLHPFRKYYEEYRLKYETGGMSRSEVDNYLKASYIDELEKAFDGNTTVFRRKSQFYYSALTCALMSVIPYLVCLGFHIAKKDDSIYKVEIVNALKRQ